VELAVFQLVMHARRDIVGFTDLTEVAPIRHWVTCNPKPYFFLSFFGPFMYHAICPKVLI